MQHRSICFSIKDLSTIYDIVKSNKECFKEISKSFEKLSSCIEKINNDNSLSNNYYMIISDECSEDEINQLLNLEESKIALVSAKTKDNLIKNIISCIEYVINNVEICPNWKWVNGVGNTYETFQFIHN